MRLRSARIVSTAFVACAGAIGALPLLAAPQEGGPVDDSSSLATEASRRAAEKALRWLVRNQEDDGALRCDVGFKLNHDYRVERQNEKHVGVTALAGTAFLAAGSVPDRGPYAD